MFIFEAFLIAIASLTFWTWGVFFVLLGLISRGVYTTDDKWEPLGWSTFFFIITMIFLYSVAETDQAIEFSFSGALVFIISYTIAGIVTAFFKWWRFVIKYAKAGRKQPKVVEHKPRVTGWIAYWPLVVFMWVTIDLFKDFWDTVLESIRDYFDGWADRVYAKHAPKARESSD